MCEVRGEKACIGYATNETRPAKQIHKREINGGVITHGFCDQALEVHGKVECLQIDGESMPWAGDLKNLTIPKPIANRGP